MAIGLVGRKCGMTRIFTDAGVSVPVTVIEVDPNRITQIKTLETDGYQAIQITTGERRESRVTNPLKGHFAKAADTECFHPVSPFSSRYSWESFYLTVNKGLRIPEI